MVDDRIDTFSHRLKEALRLREIKAVELSRRTGIDKASISQWTNGTYEAKQEGVYKLAKALNVNEAWLMGYDAPMERDTRAQQARFNEWEKTHNPDRPVMESDTFQKILTRLPLYNTPVSAGTGAWLADGHEYEFAFFDDAPKGTDFALKVRGDSMEPLYSDGDTVFIKTNVIIESGQIGIFFFNGEGYLKMLQGNKLVSVNPRYKAIIINELDDFFCVGRVLGKH